MTPLVRLSRKLARDADALAFAAPIACVYNPLAYARAPHERYLERYGTGRKEVVLVGMNPGPFGMAQTGVPFGDLAMVREFLGIEGKVDKPPMEHPARPIDGFACRRSEVSGTRFWGWARTRFGDAQTFFSRLFVWNYCPLVFMEESGRNFTPDKLPAKERATLFEACDAALATLVETTGAKTVIGVGRFAEARARAVFAERVSIGRLPHPSPASPAANRGWDALADAALRAAWADCPKLLG